MVDERETTIQRLTTAFANGILPMDEFERRVELANRTEDSEALRLIAADLPVAKEDSRPARANSVTGAYLVNTGRAPGKDEVVALFASVQRVGNWTAPHKLDAVALFGSSHIDLRNALIPREGMHIDAAGIFGSVSVVVPEGVNVRVKNVAIFGSAGGSGTQIEDEEAPIIEIEAVGIFGNASVQIKSR